MFNLVVCPHYGLCYICSCLDAETSDMVVYEQLRAMLSKKVPPRLDEVIAALQEIFIKEGLLGTGNANYFPEFSTGDIILDLPSLNSDILTTEKGVNGGKQELPDDNIIRTIVILQNSLEDLTEQLDKVPDTYW